GWDVLALHFLNQTVSLFLQTIDLSSQIAEFFFFGGVNGSIGRTWWCGNWASASGYLLGVVNSGCEIHRPTSHPLFANIRGRPSALGGVKILLLCCFQFLCNFGKSLLIFLDFFHVGQGLCLFRTRRLRCITRRGW